MSIASALRVIRGHIQRVGFSIYCHDDDGCCFVGAAYSSLPPDKDRGAALTYLRQYVGPNYAPHALLAAGWTKRDALAVLDIAADCAEAEGI